MRKIAYFFLIIILFPLIILSAEENIESEILKEWRIINSKPLLAQGKTPHKAAKNIDMSMFFNKVSKNWNKLSSSTQNLLKPILLRPTDLFYSGPSQGINVVYNTTYVPTFDTTHFKIHYVTDGEDAADINFVRTVAEAFESSYTAALAKGYNPPPDDQQTSSRSPGDSNGGDSTFDVYLIDIGRDFTGTFGWTQPEGTPNNQNNDYVKFSFIVMDNDYATTATAYDSSAQYDTSQSPENFARVTAAHEFFHAIQYGYNQNTDEWFLEASAVWFEDHVFPNINDYTRYLKGDGPWQWFANPELPLDYETTLSTHEYGSGIWPIFLENSKNYPGTLKSFFENTNTTANPNVFNILDTVLKSKASDLSSAFRKFTVWNFITGKNYDSAYYDDGALYDTLYVYNTTSSDTAMSMPANASTGKLPGYMGSNYILFNKGGTSLRIMFNGMESPLSSFKWNASVLIKNGATYTETTIALDTQNSGGITIDTTFDSVILIPSIYETTHARSDLTKFPYQYGFSNDTTAPSSTFSSTLTVSDVPSDQGYVIKLTWSASSDDTTGGSIESYDILRSTSSGTGFTLVNSFFPNGSAAYTTTSAVPLNKTNYYYKIRARDKWLNYETTGEVESLPVQAIDNIPPVPPTHIKAVNTPKSEYGKSIDLTWTRSSDDGSGANDVAKYTIFRSTTRSDLSSFQTAGVAAARLEIYHDTTGIINGNTYYYYLQTEDSHPNYAYSTAYYFYNTTTTDTSHDVFIEAKDIWISSPSGFKAVGINDQIALAWKNPDVLDFARTIIRSKTASYPTDENDGTNIPLLTDSTASNTGITVGETYYYSAISLDTTGNYSTPDDSSRVQASITLKAFNYPNPTYSGSTKIRYQLENTSGIEATLYIFDIAGELVLEADNILTNANNSQPVPNIPVYEFSWDGRNGKGRQVASGVYIFMIEANDSIPKKDRTGKIAVIK